MAVDEAMDRRGYFIFMALPGKFCMVVELGLFQKSDLGPLRFPPHKRRGPPPLLCLIYKITCFKFQTASYKGFHNHAKFAQ